MKFLLRKKLKKKIKKMAYSDLGFDRISAMALNFSSYSHFPSFPASIRSEDDFGTIVWDRGNPCWPSWPENRGNPCWPSSEIGDLFEHGGGKDRIDPIDMLPADPFGMELSSNLAAAAIVSLLPFFDCKLHCRNWDYEDTSGYWPDDGSYEVAGCGIQFDSFGSEDYGDASGDWVDDDVFEVAACGIQDDTLGSAVEVAESSSSSGLEQEGLPHEGLVLSLGYLGLEDLLSVEKVCRSLHVAVRNDPLLWRCIHIASPLNDKITDDALLRLTSRAQRSLQCLSLAECSRITDEGLKKVLESNPRLQKLSVYGCRRLTIEGLINNLKAFKSSGAAGIKHLILGKWFSVSPEQYEELQTLLGGDEIRQPKPTRPRFKHCGGSSIACDDDRPLDIEMCPGCQKFKLVFDCPSESCQAKGSESCRACEVCIGRCAQCGRCVKDCRFVETFFLDLICSACMEESAVKLGTNHL